jgi:hypothetical protein
MSSDTVADNSGNTVADNSGNTVADNSGNTVAENTSMFNKDNYLDKNTLLLTGSFLAIYFIIYAILGIFYDGSDPSQHSSKASFTDMIVLIIIGIVGWVHYNSLTPSQQDSYWPDLLNSVKGYLNNAYSILEMGLFIIFFYVGIYFFGIPMNPTDKTLTVSFLDLNCPIFKASSKSLSSIARFVAINSHLSLQNTLHNLVTVNEK